MKLPSLYALSALLCASSTVLAAEAIRLTPSAPADEPTLVQVELKLSGELSPKMQAEATERPKATPVAVNAQLAYRQQPIDNNTRAVRQYTTARVSTGDKPAKKALRTTHQLIVAESDQGGPAAYAVAGALLRSEVDLLELPADPLLFNRLLPNKPVQVGDSWIVAKQDAADLMVVDHANLGELNAVLTDVSKGYARFRLAGSIHGTIDGATTEIDLRGVALFDRSKGRLSKLNLSIQERRSSGPATPAIDASMKLNVSVAAAGPEARIAATTVDRAAKAQAERRLLIEGAENRWSLLADRDWFVTSTRSSILQLKQVGTAPELAEAPAAVATLRLLAESKSPSVAKLESDVRYSLGKQMSRVLATNEANTANGLHWVAVGAEGQLEDGSPVEWRHYHIAGNNQAIAMAIEMPVLAGVPVRPVRRDLIESLRFKQEATAAKAPSLR